MKFCFTTLLLASSVYAELPDVVDFNDHIQPILSENCYHCHGPDSSTREPKKHPLRLDREEFAFEPRSNGKPTIIKGDPEASELIKRIVTKNPDHVMPTPESHRDPLKPKQIALIKKWIKQDAPYEEHWSFIKPQRPDVPKSTWGNNPVDAFIAAKHQTHHLQPNPPAPPHRLLRRLTFDITGLPPTKKDIAAFEKAYTQNAKTAVADAVEKLLKTDGYAENFARHWLDAARYADTHGIHIDNYRSIWPYRDWVIQAFRENKSFKDFTVEQIAGDLLPNASLEQKIATGFNRCLPTTGEGGAIAEEYEAIYAKDRVETTSAIWLGLTTGCAACHDHKFDPISQKDFYSMAAYFRNSTMDAMDRNNAKHPPNVFAPRQADRTEWNSLTQKIADLDKAIAQRRKEAGEDYHNWMIAHGTTPVADAEEPDILLPLVVKDKKITGTVDGQERTWSFTHGTKDKKDIGKITNISGINIELGDIATFDARDQVTFGGHLLVDGNANGPIISRVDMNNQHRGWDLWLEKSHLGSHIVDVWPGKAIKATTKSPLTRNKWQHVMVTYDGQAKPKKSLTIYINGKAVPIRYSHSGKVDSILTDVPTRLGSRHPEFKITGKALFHDFQFYRRKLSPKQIMQASKAPNINQLLPIPVEERNKSQKDAIYAYYIDKVDPPTKALQVRKNPLLNRQNKLRSNGATTLVMEEKKGDAYAHILDRGEYTLETEKVFAAIPEVFQNKSNSKAKQSRKHLAEWIVSPDNPLTHRVTVNRIWYYFFGRGLVETTEDFGIMGARPTHPALLDYLALEFVESGWDIQHIIKLITTSATYQQSGKVTSTHREKDPTNLYLARSPRHRMEAEQIRDMALAASGLLVNQVGGPPVKPYQPEGIWEAVAMKQSNTRHYKQSHGKNLYRRSIYTFWKRTAPHPSMEILNAPTREVFCVRRDLTNTPLQAFVTLNDIQFVEAARKLAEEALTTASDFNERLDHITLAFTGRLFQNEERQLVRTTFDQLTRHYASNPDLAAKLLTVGESKSDPSLKPEELTPWSIIASQIFNLDETLTK